MTMSIDCTPIKPALQPESDANTDSVSHSHRLKSGNSPTSSQVPKRPTGKRPAIYAHRGSSSQMPENTAPAYDWALACGADVLETDVRLSAQGTLFMFHDERLGRITNGSGRVASASDAELATLDAAYNFVNADGSSMRDQGIGLLSLDAMFAKYPDTRINIDIKDNNQRAVDEIVRLIRHYDRTELTTVGSFHTNDILSLRAMAPEVRTAALKEEVARLYFGRMLPGRKAATEAALTERPYKALQMPLRYFGIPLTTEKFIAHGKTLGLDLVFWTVNERKGFQKLQTLGVDGIVTDRPDLAKEVLGDGTVNAW